MNPVRPSAPAVVSGYYINLWFYLTVSSIGTSIVAMVSIIIEEKILYK